MQTIRQKIVDDEKVQSVISRLIGDGTTKPLTSIIHERYEAKLRAENALSVFDLNGIKSEEEQLAIFVGEVAFEISRSDEYKNEGQRKAALAMLLKDHVDYQACLKCIKDLKVKRLQLEQNISKVKIDLIHANNHFLAVQSAANVVAGLSREEAYPEFIEVKQNPNSHKKL